MTDNGLESQLLDTRYKNTSQMLGGFCDVPETISMNLRHELRPYQKEAIGRYLFYYDSDKSRDVTSVSELLFNMATGSGKTLIMAGLLLDLYKRGYNKVIFFVNTTNILEKTRENFLEKSSNKYLFADKIVIDGEVVNIQEVSDFSSVRDDSINIVFTTIQGLHTTLKSPRENGLTYEDLCEHDLVLLSDEAHHLQGSTKSKAKKDDNTSWESTVNTIMRQNQKNVLLEFTATIDLNDKEIFYKYKDKIIYRYDLKAFREDGYSKDVWIYDVVADKMDRAIQAMLVSQYRKKIALDGGVWLKPVVMFKSFRIADSNDFYDDFVLKVKELQANDIARQRELATGILKQAFDYYDKNGISEHDLADELRYDFAEERLLSVTKNIITPADQQVLNSLENKENQVRAIFAVNVLDEGWDVLNLYDIVRLYDTRDSKSGRAGKTTMAEAQLIGRGARYFPFVVNGDEESRYVRKFDHNETERLRVIEQLHYHSASNPRYIQEIRQALRDTGILASDGMVKREINLKDDFKQSRTYQKGLVWKNKQVPASPVYEQAALLGGDGYKLQDLYEVEVPAETSHDRQVFDNATLETNDALPSAEVHVLPNITFARFPKNLVRYAVDRNKKLRYDIVAKKISGINSLEAFLTGNKQLGGVKISITAGVKRYEKLSAKQKLYVIEKVLDQVASDIRLTETSMIGSRVFEPEPISKVFSDKVVRNYTLTTGDAEFGISQSIPTEHDGSRYFLDLAKEDWYAYSDNFGTSEEKQFVLLMKRMVDELKEKWSDVYLIRNEGAFKIYEFSRPARAFEPDYVLVANDKREAGVSWQIFIEPKGGNLIEHDKWKQDFLKQITEEAEVLGENDSVRIVGLPFYNSETEKQEGVITARLSGL